MKSDSFFGNTNEAMHGQFKIVDIRQQVAVSTAAEIKPFGLQYFAI